jgi:hypothetical protein
MHHQHRDVLEAIGIRDVPRSKLFHICAWRYNRSSLFACNLARLDVSKPLTYVYQQPVLLSFNFALNGHGS